MNKKKLDFTTHVWFIWLEILYNWDRLVQKKFFFFLSETEKIKSKSANQSLIRQSDSRIKLLFIAEMEMIRFTIRLANLPSNFSLCTGFMGKTATKFKKYSVSQQNVCGFLWPLYSTNLFIQELIWKSCDGHLIGKFDHFSKCDIICIYQRIVKGWFGFDRFNCAKKPLFE